MGDAPELDDGPAAPARIRVRTPGKHIVLFSLAVTFMIAVSTLALSRADFRLPRGGLSAAGAPAVEKTFVADLSPDTLGRLRLARVAVRIEASSAGARRALAEKSPQIQERIAFFLRETTPEDLDGTEAQARLKAELLRRVNLTIAPEAVDEVVIQSLIVQ
jgi:flagellar basal body-associated protein FliL